MRKELTLADGRTLAYGTFGDPDGSPVIFNHGFSDSHVIRNPDDGLTASLGVCWISADQPGVGGSSPQPGRKMVDWGADMEQLADHLRLDKFNVAGHSGGGPHALSIAHRLPDRVNKVVLASPVAPFDDPGVTKMLVMRDLKMLVLIRHCHLLLRWVMQFDANQVEKDPAAYVEAAGNELPSDAPTFLRRIEQTAMFAENFRLGFQQYEEGIYEMTLALWNWGFKPQEIKQATDIFYGDADDVISPRMPRFLASELPHAKLHKWAGAGHYGFVDRDRWTEFVTAAKG